MSASTDRLSAHLDQRVASFAELGGSVQEIDVHEFGDSAAIYAFIAFGSRGCGLLTVFELVRDDEAGPRTRRYAYQCSCEGELLVRYDYDPLAQPETQAHKHLPGEAAPTPWRQVTLRSVAEELRAHVAARGLEGPSQN